MILRFDCVANDTIVGGVLRCGIAHNLLVSQI